MDFYNFVYIEYWYYDGDGFYNGTDSFYGSVSLSGIGTYNQNQMDTPSVQ